MDSSFADSFNLLSGDRGLDSFSNMSETDWSTEHDLEDDSLETDKSQLMCSLEILYTYF